MRNLFLIFATISVAFALNSCEYMCVESEPATNNNNNDGECSQTYDIIDEDFGVTGGLRDWASDDPGPGWEDSDRTRYLNVFTGQVSTSPDNAHLKLVADHTSYHTEGINGTKVKNAGFNTENWDEMCDSDLLPENRDGEPTGTATGSSSQGSQGMSVTIYFKAEGKYGIVWYRRGSHGLDSQGMWTIHWLTIAVQQ